MIVMFPKITNNIVCVKFTQTFLDTAEKPVTYNPFALKVLHYSFAYKRRLRIDNEKENFRVRSLS